MHPIKEKYYVELEVMTETFVGCNGELLLGHDVIVTNNNAYIVSIEKLFKKIHKHIKEFSFSSILELMSSKESIIQNLMKKYKINPENISSKIIPIIDHRVLSSRSIMEHLKIGDHFLIPGSEIKGVLRTALLYRIVKMNKKLLKQIDETLNGLADGYIYEKNVAWSIEKVFKRIIELIPSKGHRRSITHYVDILKYVQVTDPLSHEEKSVVDTIVVAKRTNPFGEISTVIPVIALYRGTRINYELYIYSEPLQGEKVHQTIRELYRNTIPYLKESLKEFSLDLIRYEKNLIKHLIDRGAREFYDLLDNWAKEVEEGNGVYYLKIGFGGGMYSKTIFLALDQDLRAKLEKIMSNIMRMKTKNKIMIWDSLTLKLIGSKYNDGKIVPFGWIRLKIIEK